MPLYTTDSHSPWGPDIPVTTQSMVKAFRQCPRETYYKYVKRIQPKVLSTPLTRGKWVHALLEAYYKGNDWKEEHRRWTSQFNKLFDEEKEKLGDLPREVDRLMTGYLWHYGDPEFAEHSDWKVHEVELTLEAMMPNGHLFRGRVDMLVENEFGLYIVDHKTHKKLPDWDQRLFDEQSPLYVWAAHQNDIPVQGFIWNYICTAGPSIPSVLKDGKRFSKTMGDTDYPTVVRAYKAAKEEYPEFLSNPNDRQEFKALLERTKNDRWNPHTTPSSAFFRRDLIERSDDMIERVLATTMRTSERMHDYDFSDAMSIERNVSECAGWKCSYKSLSMGDLVNGDSSMAEKREYQHGDPLGYYDGQDTI